MITLEGQLEHITYYNSDNHFLIARLRVAATGSQATIKGHLPDPHIDESVRVSGDWETHPRFGVQLRFDRFEILLPESTAEIAAYLTSGIIKGLGLKTARRLIDHFGETTLVVIESQPERLQEVRGIGPAMAARIETAWNRHQAPQQLAQALRQAGIKAALGAKLFQKYGPEALDVIREDPSRLVSDFPRDGFSMADKLLRQNDSETTGVIRAKASVLHLLQLARDEGHCLQSDNHLKRICRTRFKLSDDLVAAAFNELAAAGEIVLEEIAAVDDWPETGAGTSTEATTGVYLKTLYDAETDLARRLLAKRSLPPPQRTIDSQQITATVLQKLAIQLDEVQLEVVREIFTQRLALITGGPGTGKTTLIIAVTALYESAGLRVRLAAPTGRAARRLSEVTRRRAATIHKLLGYNQAEERFLKDQDDPLDTDVLIVDEASMVDVVLLDHLLRALPLIATLILVGDSFQLPSVGPGNVLKDLIRVGCLETFALTRIYRQARESLIVVTAHQIRKGRSPDIDEHRPPDETNASGADLDPCKEFHFISESNPRRVVQTIIALCLHVLPDRMDLDPVRDIQVLAPMHKGEVGTLNLNQALQAALNPEADGFAAHGTHFRLNDKVMHLKNNYTKEVFNGDIGRICDLDAAKRWLTVDYGDRTVDYTHEELGELSLAYAISVHKSQGSEYPAVIVPLLTQHYPLLQRNLIYTALTRGQRMAIFIGTAKAFGIALKNDRPRRRLSYLAQRLGQTDGPCDEVERVQAELAGTCSR